MVIVKSNDRPNGFWRCRNESLGKPSLAKKPQIDRLARKP